MDMIRCPKCGVRNDPSFRSCVACGTALPSAEDAQRMEEDRRLRDLAPHLTDAERQRVVEEERLRQHLRADSAVIGGDASRGVVPAGAARPGVSTRTATAADAKGDMVRAAVLGLLLGLIGLGVGLVYTASMDPGKKIFGRQLIAWSAAGVLILFVLFLNFPSLSPTPPALAQCFVCNGTGTVDCPICVNGMANNPVSGMSEPCTFCNGVGSTTCTFCNGTGKAR